MPSAVSSTAAATVWHTHYDPDAERISNIIDEGLKVLCLIFCLGGDWDEFALIARLLKASRGA